MVCKRHDGADPVTVPLMPDCPFWCVVFFVPATAFHPLRDGVPNRTAKTPTVADIARMYRQGELAKMRGLGPRRLAAIAHCLPGGPHGTVSPAVGESGGPGHEYLTRLGEQLRQRGVKCELVTTGCAPRLRLDIPWPTTVPGAADFAFEDNVLAEWDADGRWRFWWPWIEQIGRADDIGRVADYIYENTLGLFTEENRSETGGS